ncbi:coiled-coil domain-containing protein 187 isoform X1 [Psammomys obesus]|uniref:coiled-coil domain-containing protein 187 isoform X1 n=1 Tax=Psammomys obesus TaxID=48139 RepID=UPI0024535842|nr:coiled-coil domain-containing protein 187 isoform X1 [Psammomys obesus]
MRSQCLDSWDVDSSVSSGRISGSSGGHESCALFRGPWKERPPLMLGPQRQPRRSNPRLEKLRDKIRAQAQWQASCASLGTSVPSSASCLFKTSSTMPRWKTPKVTNALPGPSCRGSGIFRAAEYRSKDRAPLNLRRQRSRVLQHHTLVPRTNIKRNRSASCKREIPKSSIPYRTTKSRDSELSGVYAWRKGQALVRQLLGPPPVLSRLQSKAPATELGSNKKAAVVEDSSAHAWLSKPTFANSDQHRPSHDQSATIQGAMKVLQDLRQQIQAGLELSRHTRMARKLSPSKSKPQNLAEKKQQGPQTTRDLHGSSKSPWTVTEWEGFSLDGARNLYGQQHWKKALTEQRTAQRQDTSFQRPVNTPETPSSFSQRPWSTLAWQTYPQRIREAQGQDIPFQRPGSTPETPSSFSQQPWSALAWQTYPQRPQEAQGQDIPFQRSGIPLKKASPFSQRPWSALAGQACSQRTSTACKDWEVSEPSPRSSLARPHPAPQQPLSSSFVQRSSPYSKGESAVPPLSKVKAAWPEPTQAFPQSKPAKEQDTRKASPCVRPWVSLRQSHSFESLQNFIHQKAQTEWQQAREEKALAAHTLELRNQRLQEVYRKQQEAILGKTIPVVSQKSHGIVTFVPSTIQSGGLEAPESLGATPLRKWSKVTSGMVLGDQEAPDSFCLCLNKPWNRAETQDIGRPQEGYKQARLQALETMAEVLKERIDILTTKLHKSTPQDTAADLASDLLPLDPSMAPAAPTLTPPSCLGTLMSTGGREAPQAKPLLPSTYFQDGARRPSRPPCSASPVSSTPASASQAIPHTQPCPAGSSYGALSKSTTEERHWDLEKKLQREMAALQTLGACMRSSLGVSAAPAPTCGSLWQEEMSEAKRAGLVMPGTTQSCGQQEPEGPHSGGLHGGHLANLQLKSLSFLESLKLDQQKQEQALDLLRQQAEQEVWETQMALDELVFKHQLKLMEKTSAQQRLKRTLKLEQQQMCAGLEPSTFSLNTMRTGLNSPPSPHRDNTKSSKYPGEAKAVFAGLMSKPQLTRPPVPSSIASRSSVKLCVRGPNQGLLSLSEPMQQDLASSQLAVAKFHSSDSSTYQWSIERPEPGTERSRTLHHFTIAMLEQNLRDEELHSQHQAAALRLRELALEEKTCAELAFLEHQMGCLGNVGHEAAQATLWEKQQQVFGRLEKEWRDIQYLKKVYLSLHRGRKQLLHHQQSVLNVQQSVAYLQQELQDRTQLLQSCSPDVKAAWKGVSEASHKMKEHRPGSPQSHYLQEISESLEVAHLPPEQKEVKPLQITSVADQHLHTHRVKWANDTSGTGDPPMESGHDSQGPGEQLCVSLPGLLDLNPLDPKHQKKPAFPAIKEDGSSASQLMPQETKELALPGDLHAKPSAAGAVERPLATTYSRAWSLHRQCGQSLNGDGPCPQEARVAENTTNQGLDVSRSLEGEPQEEAHWQSEQHRGEACPQENTNIPLAHPGAEQEAASPAAPVACEEEAQPAWYLDSPPSQPAAILDLCSESASSSRSSGVPALSLTPSVGSTSSLSCSSLLEFQKATATLVQLSNSFTSLSELDSEDSMHADPSSPRELSAHASWEEPGLPSRWGLHQGPSQLERVPGNVGEVTLPRLEGSGARLLSGFSEEAAVAGGSEPESSFLLAGWPLLPPHAPSPRSGSELSESSSQIWEENSEDNLVDPSPCVEPASASSLPENGSLGLEGSRGPHTSHPFPGLGEASRTSRSLTDPLNTGETRQVSPVATFTVFPPQRPSTNDSTLSLSFPLGTSTSERAGLSKENMAAEASAGCQEEPQDINTSPRMQRKTLDPKGPPTLQAPSEDGAPLVTEVASPSCVDGFLSEILSPVDEELSYGSGDLPSSIHRDTHLPPPPPTPQAKSDINEPSSEDFPSPPEEAMFPGDLLGTLGEDTSITAGDVSSLSEALGPQESGNFLEASKQDGSLDGSSLKSPLSNWGVSAPGWSPRLSVQSLSLSPVACVAREDLEASDNRSGPREVVQCLQGTEHLLDGRVGTSSPPWPAPAKGPPPGREPLVPSGQAESLKHTSEKEKGGQSYWTEDQPKLQDLLTRQQLPRRDWAFDHVSEGAYADLIGTKDVGPVAVVSTHLSRRILCDSLAALSLLVPGDST